MFSFFNKRYKNEESRLPKLNVKQIYKELNVMAKGKIRIIIFSTAHIL